MSYDEDEVLSDSDFSPKEDDELDEPLEGNSDFRFDEEESEAV